MNIPIGDELLTMRRIINYLPHEPNFSNTADADDGLSALKLQTEIYQKLSTSLNFDRKANA